MDLLVKVADRLLKWSLQTPAEPESQSQAWGCTYLLGRQLTLPPHPKMGGGEPEICVGSRSVNP